MRRTKKTFAFLLIAAAFVLSAFAAQAKERQKVYAYDKFTAITPDDTAKTIKGALWIQVTVAGNVTFLLRDGTASPAYPMTTYSTFELGYQHVGIKADGTTATGIFAFWPTDVPDGPLP